MRYTAVLLLLLFTHQTASADPVLVTENEQTGLTSWRYTDENFSLQLIQLHPDYVSAFYAARGLQKDLVQYMRQQCIFGTIVRNLSANNLRYEVAEWRYRLNSGETHAVPTKTTWVKKWSGMGSAFQWSILPDEQTFAPSDWSQGFTAIPLAHGASFDFHFSWHLNHKEYIGLIKEVRCAQP